MNREVVEERILTKSWWAVALRGVLAIIFGLFALTWPGITVLALVIVFGAYAIADGIFSLADMMTAIKEHRRWWALLLRGVFGIVVGILVLTLPGDMTLVLLYLIAIWAIVTGIIEFIAAFIVPGEGINKALIGISGVLSVIIGILLLSFPTGGAVAIVWLIGIYALLLGILFLLISFGIHSAAKQASLEKG